VLEVILSSDDNQIITVAEKQDLGAFIRPPR
jgi:CMP-N-acetylneuraminic acid synthetase